MFPLGVPPTDASEFFQSIMDDDHDFGHMKYSVLALGDSNYPHYCKTGGECDKR